MRYIRVHRRRASDGMIGVNIQAIFPDKLMPLDKLMNLKINFHKKYPQIDVPILR